jgi:hypothetical protein
MAHRGRRVPARRLTLTFDSVVADRLVAYAAAAGRRVSPVAAALITEALTYPRSEAEAESREYRRQLDQFKARLRELQNEIAARSRPDPASEPMARWEWPVDTLLEDSAWWDRWLPRLNELLGRREVPILALDRTAALEKAVDDRGYHDLLSSLFPPIVREATKLTWRSPGYAAAAASAGLDRTHAAPRADVWEPVLRHVAEALSLLESTGQVGADPYFRLRADAEITGSWLRVLRYLVGEEQAELPRQPLA